uniref:PPM-type phosphatase domain-containing protein n=1 Tax=Rhodosorus marinus TaxID=101924 RepID=A0A7S0BUB8_9RHOD|mmetsp:Transcript_8079/g.11976  ORF Transcript_8079/g.11976 Transcript_8079/m.11976 type:complete len:495 (+) Transcript_8079:117-1601(+)
MLKRFRKRLGKGEESAAAAEDGKEETVKDGVKGRNGGQEDLVGADEPGPDLTESQDDDEEATGAIDADGLRAARARLSLDDGTIRSQPKDVAVVTKKPTEEELNRPEKAAPEPNKISEGPSDSAEGRVARKSNLELPVLVGTSGLAGWEPLQGPYRRRSVEVRKENQDAFLALLPFNDLPHQLLLGVFDGHGAEGRKVSHTVRDAVCKSLVEYHREEQEMQRGLRDSESEKSKAEKHMKRAHALKTAFHRAEQELYNPFHGIDHKYSGTTCVLVWIIEMDLYCAWVGDSRAVIGRGNGPRDTKLKAIEVSHDQKPSRSDEKKRVKAAGGRIARWRKDIGPLRVWVPTEWIPGLAMTRSIGDTVLSAFGVTPAPEISYMRLSPSDMFLILGSDGLWEFMTSQEAVDFISSRRKENLDPDLLAEGLVREAIKRWRRNEDVVDDTTAVVLVLNYEADEPKDAIKGSLFSTFGKPSPGVKPVLIAEDGKTLSFQPKNE